MLSPQLRQKVFNLWTMFWTSGMTNPMTAIEQITYLLFLKQLEAFDSQRVSSGKPSIYAAHEFCRWFHIRKNPTHELFTQKVFPWLRQLDEILSNGGNNNLFRMGQGIMDDAYFQFPREKARTLEKAIKIIDELFPQMNLQGSDLMGDIFEYLLSEIKTSGKNGQFRTPRHIIRFMVELLKPQPGERVIDPAAGTGGFLFTTIQYLLKEVTPLQVLKLEADGTPHRLVRNEPNVEPYLTGEYFTGCDNDRTMVRIGWMNLILHGIENPRIERRDTLGQSLPSEESNAYDLVFANPPFTGSVDKDDLHKSRFPRDPRRSDGPITTKSELLFVWLMLDLLKPGGRAAVIVPEGVLFGSTVAHKELRRQLLFEHNLQAVISLPAGAFQPYSGVKTSILVFQKAEEEPQLRETPYTNQVWFYEVQADGYKLDAKRRPQPENNDLWDAQEKYSAQIAESQDYYKPTLFTERWRIVDDETVELFPELADERGDVWDINKLFELPAAPQAATEQVINSQTPEIEDFYRDYLLTKLREAASSNLLPPDAVQAQKIVSQTLQDLNQLFKDVTSQMLDTQFDQHGRKAFEPVLEQMGKMVQEELDNLLKQVQQTPEPEKKTDEEARITEDWRETVESIVREFAKLDGFDVQLRSIKVQKTENLLEESRSWVAPVRTYARDDDWQSEDGTVLGTHDENGQVRPEYIEHLRQEEIFDKNGVIKAKHLDVLEPDCIEANDFNLSAGRHKPFVLETRKYDPPADILRKIRELEEKLIAGIDSLQAMVEDRE